MSHSMRILNDSLGVLGFGSGFGYVGRGRGWSDCANQPSTLKAVFKVNMGALHLHEP
jgi:hypothetical protein